MIVRAKTKIRLHILLASVVLLIGAAATVYVVRKSHSRQFYASRRAEGMTFYKNGDYANALVKLQQVIRREEYAQDPQVLYAFAESRKRVESPDGKHLRDAMTMLQRVLAIDSASNIGGAKREDVQRELLDLYTQLGYNSEAIALAETLLKTNPKDLQLLRAQARGKAASQQSEEAWKLCEAFNSNVPLDLDMRILSLEVLRDLRRRPEIFTQLVDLLKKYPKDGKVELITSVGFTLVEGIPQEQREDLIAWMRECYPTLPKATDKLPDGVKNLEEWELFQFSHFFAYQAAQRDPGDLVFVRYLIEQLDRTRQVGQSLAVLQKVDAQQQTPWVRNLLIRRLWEAEQFELVLKRIGALELKGATPAEVEMLGMLGVAQAQSDLPGPAAATATVLARLKEDRSAQAWSTIINELFLKTDGNALQVINSINSAFEMQRNNPYLRFFQGLAYLRQGESDAGYEAIAQVVAARPLWPLPMIHLSRLKLEAGRLQSAYEDASEAFTINPTLAAVSNLATIKAALIGPSKLPANNSLLTFVSDIRQKFPDDESTLPVYVQLLARTKQAEKAKTAVNEALSSKKPPSVPTLLRLANVSREANLGLEEACLAVAEKSGLTPEIAYARGIIMAEGGNSAAAVTYLQDCMGKSGAGDVSWRLALANLLEHIRDNRAAATWVALGDDPALKTNFNVQRQALAAASVQKDTEFLTRTVGRTRALAGEQSIGWKMAQARMLLRDPAKSSDAIKMLTDIVTSAPSNIEARVLLAGVLDKSGKIPAAIEQLLAARKLQTEANGVNLELARLYTIQTDFQLAREILDTLSRGSLEPAQGRLAARLSAQQGRIDTAIHFMEAAQADASPVDRLFLADLYRRANRQPQAEAIYKSLLEKPDQIEVIVAAADYFASRGRTDLAMQALANLDKLSLKPGVKDFAMARYSSHYGNANEALTRYLAVVEQSPREPNGWRALVSEYIRLGKPDDAVQSAKKAMISLKGVEGEPGRPFQNVIDSAPSLNAMASRKELIPLMTALTEPSPNGDAAARSLPIIVNAIQTNADPLTLAKQLREIADAAPSLAQLQILLMQKYIQGEKPEDAATIALRSLRISPGTPELARNAALAVTATGRFADALPFAEQWAALIPENTLPADVLIAQLHINLNDHASALRKLERYIAQAKANPKDPDLAAVNVLRGQALALRGDVTAAWDLLGPLLADQRPIRMAWRQLAEVLPNALADKWLTRLAAATPPDDVEENINLAFAWQGLFAGRARFKGSDDPKHKQNAVALIEHLASIAPNNAIVVQSRAMLAELDNRPDDAERGYRRAVVLNPNLAFSLNNLAMMTCNRGDLKEALSLAQRAVAANPREPKILDTLAFVHLKMKNYPDARKSLMDALKLQPQDIHWRVKLAQVYDEAGQHEELAKLLDEIESMTPGAKVSETDLQTIRQLRSKIPAKTALR